MTSRFRFSVDTEDHDGRTVFSNTTEFDAEVLPDIIGNFELFLKGAGFELGGHVDITPAEEYTTHNTYNSHPGAIQVKRSADTEGGSIE
jgi:hypothetical protein